MSCGLFFSDAGRDYYAVHLPLPAEPTDALPGTEAKIRALARRARMRTGLHHPADARPSDAEALGRAWAALLGTAGPGRVQGRGRGK